MRGGTMPRNPEIQLAGQKPPSRPERALARSCLQESSVHSFIQSLRDIAAIGAAVLLVAATGIGLTFSFFALMFCSF